MTPSAFVQSRHDGNFHSLDGAIGDQISPRRQVGSNFPLAVAGRYGRDTRMLFADHIFQGSLVFVVDRAIAVVVDKSLVRADDEVLRVLAVQADHHGWA